MRGFAQTAHCPRCGTAKPTGGDVAPIVTCGTCGLGFDPRPRDPVREPRALATVEQRLVHEDVGDDDVLLSARDSVWSGIFHVLAAVVLAWFVAATYAELSVASLVAFLTLGAWSLYAGVSRLVNRIYVHVSAGSLAGWERPLPRHRQHTIVGDVRAITVAPQPTRRTYDVVVDGARLVNVPHAELATELAAAIREHRARLGAAVADGEEDE